jgi:hypothetical protein
MGSGWKPDRMSRYGLGFVSGGGTPGNDAFTKILLHMDGSNGGTTFTDVNAGGSAHTWTATSATTSTASPKFGTASLLTSVGYITTPDHADYTLGSGDFTFDFWVNSNGTTGLVGLAGQMDATGTIASTSLAVLRAGGAAGLIQATLQTAGVTYTLQSTTGISSTSTWNHIEIVRSGSTARLFFNGTQEHSLAVAGALNDSSSKWSVGRIGDNTSFAASSCKFDEPRLSVGVARHTANFTPPVSAYT